MAKSSRRKKQDQAKAQARRAEQSRLRAKAERDRQQAEHFRQLLDPLTRPDEVARLVAAELADVPFAGTVALLRLSADVPAGELAEAAELLLASTAEPPAIGALAFAAVAAHAAGDEDGEHRYTGELLARADAGDDDGLRLEVIRSIVLVGHPGEAVELIEPHLRDSPDDEEAAEIYATAVERALELAEPGERERAALDRFADRSGLAGLRDAIAGYLERTTWGETVRNRVEEDLAQVADEDWPPAYHEAFAAFAFEAAVNGAGEGDSDDADADIDIDELLERESREGPPETALTAFAADPSVPPELASRASAWAEYALCGVWQLADPVPQPGVWCTDLVSGTRRYVEFPAAVLDGAPPWTVWLGSVGPVDGIWRSTGTGLTLSPAEGDAVTEFVDQAVAAIAQLIVGVPRDEIPEPEPIRFGRADPCGVRWGSEEPLGAGYARLTRSVTMALMAQLAAQVARYRATPGPSAAVAGAAPPAEGWERAWLDEQVPALDGHTPREAAACDDHVIRLESLLRQFEYQAGLAAARGEKGIDVAWLRTELGMLDMERDW